MNQTSYGSDRFTQFALIAVFVIFLSTPMIGQFSGFSGSELIQRIEYREPAPLPVWPDDREGLKSLPAEIDAHVNDYFGFRSQLVRLNSGLQYLLGASGSERVLIGNEGWLFLKTRHRVVDEYRGLVDVPDSEIDAWVQSMVNRRDWLAERGIPFVLAIPPIKHTTYSEYLPSWVQQVGPTRLDRTIEKIRSETDLVFVDIRRAVADAKLGSSDRLYDLRGTHWNYEGAFLGYTEIMKAVHTIYPDLPAVPADDIEFYWHGTQVGDLTRMLHLDQDLQEPFLDLRFREESKLKRVDVMRDEALARGNVRHTQNENLTSVARSKFADRPNALIIRDSYTNAMAPFLRETFGETVFTHHRRNTFDRALVELFQPDIVIFVIVEKALYFRPTDLDSRSAATTMDASASD